MADEVDEKLAKMRRAMGKLSRQGRTKEFEALSVAYAELKKSVMERAEVEQREQARARRAALRAQRPVERSGRWKLPAGFGVSPLAAQRARSGGPREEPTMPAGGLRPWRRYGSPMQEQIWRP